MKPGLLVRHRTGLIGAPTLNGKVIAHDKGIVTIEWKGGMTCGYKENYLIRMTFYDSAGRPYKQRTPTPK